MPNATVWRGQGSDCEMSSEGEGGRLRAGNDLEHRAGGGGGQQQGLWVGSRCSCTQGAPKNANALPQTTE